MASFEEKLKIIKDNIATYPEFPKPGVIFKDIFSVYNDADKLQLLREVIVETAKGISPPIDAVAALDARGFLIGPLICLDLHVPFIAIRKKGKLPGEIFSESYSLEYGQDILEIQRNAVKKGQRVLIVDDLLATGGSLGAACKLVEKAGGAVATCLVVIEIEGLKGREKLKRDVISLIKF